MARPRNEGPGAALAASGVVAASGGAGVGVGCPSS